jgi:hypothetical protein
VTQICPDSRTQRLYERSRNAHSRVIVNCFNKGAKATEVSLATAFIHMSRGGGYECDEYSPSTLHFITLYKYSLLVPFVLFHRYDVLRGYVTIAISKGAVFVIVAPGTHMHAQLI